MNTNYANLLEQNQFSNTANSRISSFKRWLTQLLIVFSLVPMPMLAAKKKTSKPNGAYQLIAQLDNGKMIVVGYKNSNILFNQETGKFNAYVGCNTISGMMSGKRNELRLAQLTKTDKACPDYIDGLEEQFMKHLENVTAYRWEGNSLLLLNNNTVLMKLKPKQ